MTPAVERLEGAVPRSHESCFHTTYRAADTPKFPRDKRTAYGSIANR